jgi:CheY-like chemotaxis protein
MSSGTVLLATRDEDSRVIYSTYLTYCGYTVITAESGDEGVRVCLEQGVDIIVVDPPIVMASGDPMTRALRDLPLTRALPIIGVTAWTGPFGPTAEEGAVTQFLLKPLTPVLLAEEVQRLLNR